MDLDERATLSGSSLEFRVIGPLEVLDGGRPVALGGARQRALLAVLLVRRGEVASTDRLVDDLWGERPPATAVKTVHVYVSRLRKVLGEELILTRTGGYVLTVEPGQVDQDRFEALIFQARDARDAGDPRRAAELLSDALGLWRGSPLDELADRPVARGEILRLEEMRLAALSDRMDAELALGQHTRAVAELEALVQEHPLSERLSAQLMLALYRSGRQADALEVYQAARRALTGGLGIEPGADLRELQRAILAHDRELEAPVPSARRIATKIPRTRRGRVLAAGVGLTVSAVVVTAAVALNVRHTPTVPVAPNSLAAIDPRTNHVVATVPTGASPGPIAFGAGSLWVANVDDMTISRIDPVTLRALATLTLGGTPTGLAADAQGIWVVQANRGSSSVSVDRIDPLFDSVGPVRRLAEAVPGAPGAVSALGGTVWVAPSSGSLSRLDARTGRVLQQLAPAAGLAAIAVGDGDVWVAGGEGGDVTDVSSAGSLTTIPAGNGPTAIAVGAGAVWVADSIDNSVVRIDPNTDAVTTTIPVGRSPSALAVGAGSVWVADSGDGTITRIDPATNSVSARIRVGGSPQAITIADGRAWVTVDGQTAETRPATSGGTLRVELLNDVDSMDPALAYTKESWELLNASCAKLLNYPAKPGPAGLALTPEVAASLPQRSADGRTYIFTIRSGFRFSPPSNQAVTAQTFKDTIERTLSPKMNSPAAKAGELANVLGATAYMAGKAPHVSGVVARGDTLTITLRRREPDILSILAQAFFCAVPSDTPTDPNGVNVIPSAGPYYVTSYAPGQGLVLARNPNYHGSRPHLIDRIEVTEGISSQRAVADVQAGTADLTTLTPVPAGVIPGLVPKLAERYGAGSPAAAHGDQRLFATGEIELAFLVLNTHRSLFGDERMRQAVSYAVNRRALAQLGDWGALSDRPTSQYLPPPLPGSTAAEIYPLTPNVARARALATGRGRTAVLYTCDWRVCFQQAQVLKNNLAAIGLRVAIKVFPLAVDVSRLARPGEPFDLAFYTWLPDYPDPEAMLNELLENSSNFPRFADASYRRRLAAAAELTGPERYRDYGELALDLARTAPLIAYGNASVYDFFSARVGCQRFSSYYGIELGGLCVKLGGG